MDIFLVFCKKDRVFFLSFICEQKKQNFEVLCQGVLSLGLLRSKAYMNLVMASCSDLSAKSVVELTSSRHFHYHYSNISKISHNLCQNEEDYQVIFNILLTYFLSSCELPPSSDACLGTYYSFSQDMCMVSKPASACLADKVYGHKLGKICL